MSKHKADDAVGLDNSNHNKLEESRRKELGFAVVCAVVVIIVVTIGLIVG